MDTWGQNNFYDYLKIIKIFRDIKLRYNSKVIVKLQRLLSKIKEYTDSNEI